MFKKLFLLSSFICAQAHAMIYLPKNITFADAKKYASQKKVIIGYDVHDVLVRKDKFAKFKTITKHLPTVIGSKITDGHLWDQIDSVKKPAHRAKLTRTCFQRMAIHHWPKWHKNPPTAISHAKGWPLW